MSWIRIQRTPKRSRDVATLSISRRQRNGRVEHWARLGLGAAMLEQLALAPGDHVELFLGHDENQGKIALRKSEARPECFRLTRYGAGACLAFSADLLGLGSPTVLEKQTLEHRLAGELLELTLPQQPEAMARPALPCAEAPGEARAVALKATISRAIRSVEPPSGRKSPVGQIEDAAGRRGRYGAAWTAEDDAQLRQMRQAGLPAAAIAEALGRTSASIALRISKLQLPKGNGRAGHGHPASAARREAPDEAHDLAVTEALDWLRWNGEPVERLDGGSFCIAGERVTPHRLVQIANLRRARRSPPLPPLPLPAPALLYPPRRPAASPDHIRQRDSA